MLQCLCRQQEDSKTAEASAGSMETRDGGFCFCSFSSVVTDGETMAEASDEMAVFIRG